ncbi:MAG TPA: hypothetical protein VFJ16_28380 [Longimicrobium sp.]|nr:hypothetical protein [Longimicrobium sp.]
MKKKLRIEDLGVESFEVSEASTERGTVRGNEDSGPPNCFSGVESCLGTCEDTCGLTCWDTCWPDLTCTCA